MDIPALSMSLNQMQLQSEVSTAITGLKLDQMETSKEQFLDLLESTNLEQADFKNLTEAHLGNNLDIIG